MAEEIKIVIDPIFGSQAKITRQAEKSGKNAGKAFTDGFEGESRQTDPTRGLKKSFSGLGGIVKSALNPINAVIGALGAGFAVKGVVDAGAQIERIEAQFQTLLGSADAAQSKVQELSKFAAGTPFQLSGISDAAAGLLAFGFEADSLTDRLTKIGDVASGSNSDLKEVGLIYGQVAAAGKLTGERLLQLQERAIPIGSALAKSLGVAESEVKKLVSAGKVGFPEFEKAFNSLSEAGGQFEGATARQSKTIGGLLSTLRDNFFFLQAAIAEAFGPIIKDSIASAITSLQTLTEFIKVNIGSIRDFVLQVKDAFNSNLLPVFNALRVIFADLKILAGDVFEALKRAFSPALASAINLITNAMGLFGVTSENAGGKTLATFLNIQRAIAGTIIPAINAIKTVATIVFNSVIVGINTIIAGFGKLAGAAGRMLEFFGAGGALSQGLTDFAESSAIVLEESIIPLSDALDQMFDPVAFEEKSFQYLETLENTVVSSEEKFNRLASGGTAALGKLTAASKKAGVDISKSLQSGVVNAMSRTLQFLGKAVVTGGGTFKAFAGIAISALGDLAIAVGTAVIGSALAIDALKKSVIGSPFVAVALGAGLIAVGAAMKAFGSTLSGGSAAASGLGGGIGAGGGGFGGGGGGGSDTSAVAQQQEAPEQQASVAVNIQGDVLDGDETGLRIVEVLNSAFEKEGVVINQGAIG